MSSRKRAISEATEPPSRPSQPQPQRTHTPRAYTPSTPHAIRALQQRSGAKQRSARSRRTLRETQQQNLPRPDSSARGILKRLAQLTAPLTKKRVLTPTTAEKENADVFRQEDQDRDELEEPVKRPEFSIHMGIGEEDEEYSELPMAPTPSVLPDEDEDEEDDDDGYDATVTFKARDFARGGAPASERIERRISRNSLRGGNWQAQDEDEDEGDITAEIGRRAVSEGPPTEMFPRGSFGSIRISDFGEGLDFRRQSDGKSLQAMRSHMDDYDIGAEGDDDLDIGGETEDIRRLQRSPSRHSENDLTIPITHLQDDEDTFRLDLPDEEEQTSARNPPYAQQPRLADEDNDDNYEDVSSDNHSGDERAEMNRPQVPDSPLLLSQSHTRKQTPLQTAAAAASASRAPRRKKLKLTRHGTTIPSLPSSLIRRIAVDSQTRIGKRKPKLGKDHMKALEQATEWFFEQVGEDLEAFSSHAGRKKRVDCSDVLTLMRRQRVLKGEGELIGMAREWLPKKVLAELDLPEQL